MIINIPSVITCDKPEIANGVVQPQKDTVEFQSIYMVACDDGHTVSSDVAMICTAEGTLDVVHTCEGTPAIFTTSLKPLLSTHQPGTHWDTKPPTE